MPLRVPKRRQADKVRYRKKKSDILSKKRSDYASNPSPKKEASRIVHAVNHFSKRAAAREASKASYNENPEPIKAASNAHYHKNPEPIKAAARKSIRLATMKIRRL